MHGFRTKLAAVLVALGILVGARAGAADPDLVVWWQLDETSGATAADSSGSGMNGALTGGPAWQPTGGQVDGALYLDGVDDKISAPLTWTPTVFSVAFWINPQSLWDWSSGIWGGGWDKFCFHGAENGQVYAGVDGATRFVLPAGTIGTDVWQHFVFTFDNGEASLYKGGVPLASRSGMTMPVAWTCFETYTVRGSLDDVRVYGRALSAAEVATLYDTQHNEPPAVSVTSPTEGQTFTPGSDIAISADPSDSDGTIAKVEFFHDGTIKIGEDSTSPYDVTWMDVPAGGYALTAKATDNEDGVGTSAAVYVEVGAAVTIAKAQDAAEPSTNGSFTVTRSGDTSGAIDVGFEVDPSSTATAGADFTLSPASPVSFADGETTKTITVEVADDCAGEGLERVVVKILPGAGYGPGSPASATVNLADDEVDPDLVAWWKLDETSGAMAADSSGNGADAVLTGGPAWQPTGGRVDGALRFQDGDDKLTAPLAWAPTAFTVAFWINPQSLWDWAPSVGGDHWWSRFEFHGAANGRVYVETDAATRFVLDAGTIVTGAWQHFAFTFDNGEASFYKGGALLASTSGMTMPLAWTRFQTNPIRGGLDDVRIYGRALSAEEVWALGRVVAFERAASSGGESLSPAEFVVTLAQASTQLVTVDYSAAGLTAEPEDFSLPAGTLTFAPGETSKTIALAVVADVDGDDETVEVTLSNPAGATLGATATHVYTIHEFGIVSREVLDTDDDHRTDRVRVVAGRTLNDDFTGLAATVAGRVVLGFETGVPANDASFMIILREDEPDTGAPDVAIVSNSSLKDAATGCLVMAADTGAVTPLDEVPPVVASTLPDDGDAAVWGAGAIRVTFSEEMDRASAEAAFSTDPAAPGSFAWAGASMIFAPDAPLPDLTLYTVSVAATAEDLQGNALAAAHSFSFTTGEGLGVNIPLESAVSPAFVEGWCAPAEDLTITASSDGDDVPVTLLGPGRFYVNTPLRSDGVASAVVVTRSATGEPDLTATGAVTWTPTDITGKSYSTDSVVIRMGDSLLLTATGGEDMLVIDAYGDGTLLHTGAPGEEFPTLYDQAGEFIATAGFVSSGLVSHWEFEDGVGSMTAADSAGANDGTLVGMDPAAAWVEGRVGGALLFDGEDDAVTIPCESDYDFTSAITVAAWIRVDAFDINRQSIVAKGANAWRLQRSARTDVVEFACHGIGSNETVVGTTSVNDGLWHHVAGVYDGAELRLYVNGALDAAVPASGLIHTNDVPVAIGWNVDTSRPFEGAIDDVRIYDRGLSGTEVGQLFAPWEGSLLVTVIDVPPISAIACQVGYRREKDVEINLPEHADKVHFSAVDPALLEVSVKEYTATGATLYLEALARGTPVLTARIGGEAGPILTTKEIDEFTLESTAAYMVLVAQDLTEGSSAGTSLLTMDPLVPSMTVELTMRSAGVTFDGGLSTLVIGTNDFEVGPGGEGTYEYNIHFAPGIEFHCHDITVWQASSEPEETAKLEGVNGLLVFFGADKLVYCEKDNTDPDKTRLHFYVKGDSEERTFDVQLSKVGGGQGAGGELSAFEVSDWTPVEGPVGIPWQLDPAPGTTEYILLSGIALEAGYYSLKIWDMWDLNLRPAWLTRVVIVCKSNVLTVTGSNTVTASDEDIPSTKVYACEDGSGSAEIEIGLSIVPPNPNFYDRFMWEITPADGWSPSSGSFDAGNPISSSWTAANAGSPPTREYTVRAGCDRNEDGYLDEDEVERQIEVIVLKIEFQDQAGNPLSSPHAVGITTAAHDRTQLPQALVTPGAEASNVFVAVQGKLYSNVNTGTNPITFDLVGTAASANPGDEKILAAHSTAGTCATHSVSVLIPDAIGTPHPQYDEPITPSNAWSGTNTSPPVHKEPPFPDGVGLPGATYGTTLEVPVVDQFGVRTDLGPLYVGAEVEENKGTGWHRINSQLTGNSTYSDWVGYVLRGTISYQFRDPVTQEYTQIGQSHLNSSTLVWEDYDTLPHSTGATSFDVRVDGFALDPAVVNRGATLDKEEGQYTLKVEWP